MVLKTRVCIWDEDSESRASMLRVLNNLDAYQVTEYRAGAGGIGNLETLNPIIRSSILLVSCDLTKFSSIFRGLLKAFNTAS